MTSPNVEAPRKPECSNDQRASADFFTRFGFRHSFVIRHSCFVIGRALARDQKLARSFTANQLVDRAIRKGAASECLCCRTQRAFSTWFRTGRLRCPPAQGRASVFQLGDLESEQRNAHRRDWSGMTPLCQPCFQGDLTLGDNVVFRFHSLELTTPIFSVRHATCQLAGYGYFVYLLLV